MAKKLSHEVIKELRQTIRELRKRTSFEKRKSWRQGYDRCEKDLGKPVKMPKIKIKRIKEVRKIVKEVQIPVRPYTKQFAEVIADMIAVKAFCNTNRIDISTFIGLMAICVAKDCTTTTLTAFGITKNGAWYTCEKLCEYGLAEIFRDTTPMRVVPSLKGQKLFSSFKEYYGKSGTDSQRQPD